MAINRVGGAGFVAPIKIAGLVMRSLGDSPRDGGDVVRRLPKHLEIMTTAAPTPP